MVERKPPYLDFCISRSDKSMPRHSSWEVFDTVYRIQNKYFKSQEEIKEYYKISEPELDKWLKRGFDGDRNMIRKLLLKNKKYKS